jgi:hypothetical protein
MTEVYVLFVETFSGIEGDDEIFDVVVGVHASLESAKLAGESLKDNARWGKDPFWRIEEWDVTP